MSRPFKQSLYDWCIEQDYLIPLDLWDYELNDVGPKEVGTSSKYEYYFKCQNGIHESSKHKIQSITRHKQMPKCIQCYSFGQWCIDNNRKDFLKRWDYDLNDVDPFHISASSTKEQYFKCPKGKHKSELKNLCNMRKQYKSGICRQCESIGQWGIDNISQNFVEEYWSSKNVKDPLEVSRYSSSNIWIKCCNVDYHDDYSISPVNFVAGKRCPYCAGKKVHPKDSLGSRFPDSILYWSKINKLSPYEYMPQSNKHVWFKCPENLHNDFKRSIADSVNSEFRCPKCSNNRKQSVLQEKVSSYIESLYDDVRHEKDCTIVPINPDTGRAMPFDNEIVSLKLIIEVNGEQHYRPSAYFSKNDDPYNSLIIQKKHDEYKKKYARKLGYYVLEIPYWADDKKNTWKYILDSQISLLTV